MRVLLLWAVPNAANLGVSALYHGGVALIERAFPDAEVYHQGTGVGDAPILINHTSAMVREVFFPRQGLRKWIKGFDLVVDLRGGDSYTDIYGLKRFIKMSVITELIHHERIPYVYGPMTIGPFMGRIAEQYARRDLRRAAAVIARDDISVDIAQKFGVRNTVLATDAVFALPCPKDEYIERRDVILNVSGLLWTVNNGHVDSANYRTLVRWLIDTLISQGRDVSILAHVRGSGSIPGDDDIYALKELRDEYGDAIEYLNPTDLYQAREWIAGANLLVGARMHACLNALSVGIPAVAMAYSPKFDPLMKKLGAFNVIDLKNISVADAKSQLEWMFTTSDEYNSSVILERAAVLTDRTIQALRRVLYP